MRDRVLTESHFNYANKFVKILGFDGLTDWGKQIPYANLKTSQDQICEALNKTLDIFKALFPQDSFNLRKIHYKFENIDQVLGFFKKVMAWLSIPYEMVRLRGAFHLRLIQQKTSLYNEYISRMEKNREMPQSFNVQVASNLTSRSDPVDPIIQLSPWKPDTDQELNQNDTNLLIRSESVDLNANLSPWTKTILPDGSAHLDNQLDEIVIPKPNVSSPFELEKSKSFAHVLKTLPKTPYVKSVLTGPSISLTSFKDFCYISSIEIQGIRGTQPVPLEKSTVIQAIVGNNLLHEDIVQDITKTHIFKDDPILTDTLEKLGVELPLRSSPYVFNLDFPNSYFYCYHELELKILNSNYSLFKIQINGFKALNSGYHPIQYLIIVDHDPKYYNPETNFEWRIMSGMVGCTNYKTSIINKPQQTNFKDYLSKGLVTDLVQIYPYPKTNPPKYMGLDIQNSDMLETQSHGLDILLNYHEYIDKTYDFVMCNSSHKLNFSFIEENPNSPTSSIYYPMARFADAIGRVGLSKSQLNKLTNLDTNVKVSFVSIGANHNLVQLGTLSFANPSINLENFYYLLPKQYSEIFLIIDAPNAQLYQWLQIDMIFGLVFFDTDQRRHIAQNFDHNE